MARLTRNVSTSRNAFVLALVVGCCSLAGALPNQNANQHASANAGNTSFQAKIQSLVGEWQGTCEVQWAANDTTTTELNVSVKANANGGVLVAYDSFARGKTISGVANWSISNNQLSCSNYDTRSDWQCNFNAALPASNQASLTGTSSGTSYTQNINFRDDGKVVIEYYKAGANNTQELVQRFTMTRLSSDKLSSASAYLDDAKLLAKVNYTNSTKTAGVNSNE